MRDLSPKTKLIVIAVGILLVGLIFFIVWYSARKAGKLKGTTIINTSNPGSDTSTSASESEIRQVAGDLYGDMDGANIMGHNLDAWQRFMALSDSDVVRVYNEFDLKYQKPSGQTFKEWVQNESSPFLSPWSTVKETVLARLNKLNLL